MHSFISPSDKSPSIVVSRSSYEKIFGPEHTSESVTGVASIDIVVSDDRNFAILAGAPDWLRFRALVAQWKDESLLMSSVTDAVMCPSYQSIVGMGQTAVRFLLKQLSDEGNDPDQWFWALKAITGADPVDPKDAGDYPAMSRAWMEWGIKMGYAW